MIHDLKTWPEPFQAILTGVKSFEIRKADRPFEVGDGLRLLEYDPVPGRYTGREIVVRVMHIARPGEWGLPADLCVMGIEEAGRTEN